MAVSSDIGNIENLKESVVFVFPLALHMLNHHIRLHLHDLVQRLLQRVPLHTVHVFVECLGEGPSSISVDCSKEIDIVLHFIIIRVQQRSEKKNLYLLKPL